MKFMKRWMLFLCAGMILFNSCKKTSPPQLEAIPGDAIFVLAFEGKKIAKKGELEKLQDYKFIQKIVKEFSKNNPAAKKSFDEFIQSPKSVGVNFDQFYLYGMNPDEKFYCAGVFKMDNATVFEEKMKEIVTIENDSSFVIEDKGNYKLIPMDKQVALVWNQNLLFILAGDCENINFDTLFTLPKEKSIIHNSDFAEFQKQKYDIGCWGSYSLYMKLYGQVLQTSINSLMKEYEGMYMHAYLNFEKGEIKMIMKMTPKDKVDEFYAKHPIINKDFNQKLLNDFPETSYFSFKLSLQWAEFIKYFKEVMKSMNINNANMQPTLQMIGFLDNPTVKTFTDALGGDILLGVYGFAQGPLPIPLVGISLSVKSKEDFDKALTLIPQKKQEGDYYVIESDMKMPAYLAYKDNRVFMTDDADAIIAFTGKGYSKTLKNNDLSDSYKKDPFFFYLNLDLDSYPENVKTFIYNESPKDFKKTFEYLKPYRDFTIGSSSIYESYGSIRFKDKKQNSLKQFLTSIDRMMSLESK